jgi:hypothetical protein
MSESQSILTKCFRNGSDDDMAEEDSGDTATIIPDRRSNAESSTGRVNLQLTAFRHAFENELESSRVYNRTRIYDSDVSFTTSAVRTHAWSVFSGISLAQISIISAIALPLYSHEISNSECYVFGEMNLPNTHRADSAQLTTIQEDEDEVHIDEKTYSSSMKKRPFTKIGGETIERYKIVVVGDKDVGKTTLIQV